jgi:hypothetical protein
VIFSESLSALRHFRLCSVCSSISLRSFHSNAPGCFYHPWPVVVRRCLTQRGPKNTFKKRASDKGKNVEPKEWNQSRKDKAKYQCYQKKIDSFTKIYEDMEKFRPAIVPFLRAMERLLFDTILMARTLLCFVTKMTRQNPGCSFWCIFRG